MRLLEIAGKACSSFPKLENAVVWLGHHRPTSRLTESLCYHVGEQAFLREPNAEKIAVLQTGARLQVTLSEHMFRHLYFYGVHEQEVTALVVHLAGAGQTWLDVGGNIGYFSVLLSSLVGPSGRVHVFEPNSTVADYIQRSVSLNKAENIYLNQAAVSSASGDEITLYVPVDANATDGGSGRSSLIPQSDIVQTREVRVPVVALDDYIEQKQIAVDFMKIDVEGFEIQAFKGMSKTLTAHPPKVIICEVSHRPGCLASPKELISFVTQFGYQPYSIRREGLYPHLQGSLLHPDLDANVAFVHPGALPMVEALIINQEKPTGA